MCALTKRAVLVEVDEAQATPLPSRSRIDIVLAGFLTTNLLPDSFVFSGLPTGMDVASR